MTPDQAGREAAAALIAASPELALSAFYALREKISELPFPELLVEDVVDDGEEFKALRCPRCSAIVSEDDGFSEVDLAIRWNNACGISEEEFVHNQVLIVSSDSDFETLHYRCDQCGGAVSLPEGWSSSWT
jgi:hypothetical protein